MSVEILKTELHTINGQKITNFDTEHKSYFNKSLKNEILSLTGGIKNSRTQLESGKD
jgi:hypothetical protein